MSYLLAARDRDDLGVPSVEPAGDPFASLCGTSDAMRQTVEVARRLAQRSGPNMLVVGDPGTGKQALARAVHAASPRAHAPFLAVDCASVRAERLEAELFGEERGGVSDAARIKQGLFELAGDGTLFLDHVTSLPLDLQPKLLRALEERRVRRAGGFAEVEVRCRVIAATDAPLDVLVREGALREDLFHRLSLVRLALPPVRERAEDVLPLAQRFLLELETTHGVPSPRLTERAAAALRDHAWPGNLRELKLVLQRVAFAHPGGLIDAAALGLPAPARAEGQEDTAERAIRVPVGGCSLEAAEAELVRLTLELTRGNKSAAARTLGISRPTLDRKIEQYHLVPRASA